MHTIDTIIPAVADFASRHGILPSTVVRKATGNPRLYRRLKKRAEQLEEDIVRIAQFMAAADLKRKVEQESLEQCQQNTAEPATGGSPESLTGEAS